MHAAKLWLGEFGLGAPAKKADDCIDARGRAMQERLPSLHLVNEHFPGGRLAKILRRQGE